MLSFLTKNRSTKNKKKGKTKTISKKNISARIFKNPHNKNKCKKKTKKKHENNILSVVDGVTGFDVGVGLVGVDVGFVLGT